MEANPSLRESFKARVVRASILEFPKISKMLSNVRFLFNKVYKSPDSTHVKEI
jgi:hypothetical protein